MMWCGEWGVRLDEYDHKYNLIRIVLVPLWIEYCSASSSSRCSYDNPLLYMYIYIYPSGWGDQSTNSANSISWPK
jgi:hypothetical protein